MVEILCTRCRNLIHCEAETLSNDGRLLVVRVPEEEDRVWLDENGQVLCDICYTKIRPLPEEREEVEEDWEDWEEEKETRGKEDWYLDIEEEEDWETE